METRGQPLAAAAAAEHSSSRSSREKQNPGRVAAGYGTPQQITGPVLVQKTYIPFMWTHVITGVFGRLS